MKLNVKWKNCETGIRYKAGTIVWKLSGDDDGSVSFMTPDHKMHHDVDADILADLDVADTTDLIGEMMDADTDREEMITMMKMADIPEKLWEDTITNLGR